MRPDRTAKSIGFSVWRISPNVQRIHRKKRKTPKKSATGTSRARERGSIAGRSAPPQRRPAGERDERERKREPGDRDVEERRQQPAGRGREDETHGEREGEHGVRAGIRVRLVAAEETGEHGGARRTRQEEDEGEEKRRRDRHGTVSR